MDNKRTHNEVTILTAEDDDGHADLIIGHLKEAGVHNIITRFRDGEETLAFFFGEGVGGASYQHGQAYLLLLDIRMPRVDGMEVLERIKSAPHLKNMPVIMLTTTADPREVRRCYELGCNTYIAKPVDFLAFAETLRRLGLFILIVQVPKVNH